MTRAMKDSGIEWVGQIPEYWGFDKGKYHFTNNKYVVGVKSADYDRLALTMTGVIHRNKEDNEGLQPNDFNTYQLLRKNELVFKLIDLQNVSTSRIGLAHDTGIVSPAYVILHANKDINPSYAEKFYLMMWYRQIFNALGDAGVRSNLNANDLLNVRIPFPPLSEQSKIADYLDKKCGEIDSITAKIQEQIITLEEYKKSVISEAVTKGLNPNAPMKDSGIEWVEKIPNTWDVMANKYIMTKIKNIVSIYKGEPILSLTMNGVVVRDLDAGGKMPTSFDGYQRIYPNNLLMCLFDYDVTPRCIGLIKNEGVTSPAYSQFIMKNNNSSRYYYYYYLMLDNTKELLHLAKNLRH